jgi:hypothetical protein
MNDKFWSGFCKEAAKPSAKKAVRGLLERLMKGLPVNLTGHSARGFKNIRSKKVR